jgi:hypothetical protein
MLTGDAALDHPVQAFAGVLVEHHPDSPDATNSMNVRSPLPAFVVNTRG